jgi:hypothetical protein
MILFAALAIWLVLITFFVALCRGAASADGRDSVATAGYPSAAGSSPRPEITGLVLFEDQPAPVASDLRARARGGRGRAGQYAAGS